jgi:penicillin-insensitive murein endopeptidase
MRGWQLIGVTALLGSCVASSPTPRSPDPALRPDLREEALPGLKTADVSVEVEDTSAAAPGVDAVPPPEPAGDDGDVVAAPDGSDEIADEIEEEETDVVGEAQVIAHPLADVTMDGLRRMMREDFASLGSISLGKSNGGALLNGVRMPEGPRWIVRTPNLAWGTQETVDAIVRCVDKVNEELPGTPKLYIGHLSRKGGGHFPPHRSHQSGRDVDVGYYYLEDDPWYTRADDKNLDAPRTWALVRAFVTETDVQYIFIDHSIQAMLRTYAESIGEDSGWLDQVFGGKTATVPPIVRYARGHATHIHVRFYSPVAQETGRRLYPLLIKNKIIRPPSYYVFHRARKGQTLSHLATRYGVSPRAIRRVNGLRSNLIREGQLYKIPREGGVQPMSDQPIGVPPRRLPPPRGSQGTGEAR